MEADSQFRNTGQICRNFTRLLVCIERGILFRVPFTEQME